MFEEFELPDGTIATCSQDVDKYLARSGTALAGDFSDAYIKGIKFNREKVEKAERFNDFVQEYKKRIWYE